MFSGGRFAFGGIDSQLVPRRGGRRLSLLLLQALLLNTFFNCAEAER